MRARMLDLVVRSDGTEAIKVLFSDGSTTGAEVAQLSPEDVAYIRAVVAGNEPADDGSWLTLVLAPGDKAQFLLPPELRPVRQWTTTDGKIIEGKLAGMVDQSGILSVCVMQANQEFKYQKLDELSDADKSYIEDVKTGVEP